MKYVLAMTAVAMMSVPAHAVKVTNLDDIPHSVVFESTPGSKLLKTVKPGEVVQTAQPGGEVYINGQKRKIRVNAHDHLVIWDKGNLQIQMRRKVRGDAF